MIFISKIRRFIIHKYCPNTSNEIQHDTVNLVNNFPIVQAGFKCMDEKVLVVWVFHGIAYVNLLDHNVL